MPAKKKSKKQPEYILPEENMEEVPYGDPKCRLCRLPLEDLRLVNALKLKDKWSYKKMREYLKEHYGIGNDYTYLTRHFKEHVRRSKTDLVSTVKEKDRPVVEVMLTKERSVAKPKTDPNIEKAYDRLVKMTSDFTEKVSKVFELANDKMDYKKLEKALGEMEPLEMLGKIATLNRLAREQVREISALRAPKIMVMQYFEQALDESVKEVNAILTSLFIQLQDKITDHLKENGHEGVITDRLFMEVYRNVALDYKNKMVLLRREQLAKTSSALAEMEKVI